MFLVVQMTIRNLESDKPVLLRNNAGLVYVPRKIYFSSSIHSISNVSTYLKSRKM